MEGKICIGRYELTKIISESQYIDKEIKSIEDELLNRSKAAGAGRSPQPSDPTALQALSLMCDVRINELLRQQEAVKKGLVYLESRDDYDLAFAYIHAYYWSGRFSGEGARLYVTERFNCKFSKRKAENIQKKFRYQVALGLGRIKFTKMSQNGGS